MQSSSTWDGERREWWARREQKCWIGWGRSQKQRRSWVSKAPVEFWEDSALLRGVAAMGMAAQESMSAEKGPERLPQSSFGSCMDGRDPESSLFHWKISYWIPTVCKALFYALETPWWTKQGSLLWRNEAGRGSGEERYTNRHKK